MAAHLRLPSPYKIQGRMPGSILWLPEILEGAFIILEGAEIMGNPTPMG